METPPKKPGTVHQFSPIILSESPVKQMSQKGNLTGNARVIRDMVADLYNWVQSWNQHHLEGYKILKNIADLKVHALRNTPDDDTEKIYPDGLEALSNDLRRVCGMLSATVIGMKVVAQKMETVVSLEKRQGLNSTPLFLTWAVDKFGDACERIFSAYSRELEVRQCVTSEVSHCKSEPELMVHLAAWVYQPFVSNADELLMESLLIETGHR